VNISCARAVTTDDAVARDGRLRRLVADLGPPGLDVGDDTAVRSSLDRTTPVVSPTRTVSPASKSGSRRR
jgi:hypothetical protein